MDPGRPWGRQELGTAMFPSAAAALSAVAALASASAAALGAGTLYTRQTAYTPTSTSSLLSSPPRARQKRPQPSSTPAPSLPNSVTRLISSETYLRRLFVTASLSHVLSLDACLPRTMHERRKASRRIKGAGDQEEEYKEEEEDAGDVYGEQQDGAAGGISDADANINNNTETQQALNAAIVPPYSEPFAKTFPVTLIDSAGQRWSVKYMTTRRDNPHSGSLADGWDKFCSANRLKVGDLAEFTRLEAHELSLNGVRHGKDAIAKVFAYKERKDEEAKKGVGKNRTAAARFWHATNLVNSDSKVYL